MTGSASGGEPVRCAWALGGGSSIGTAYLDYHDTVWGVPERDEPHPVRVPRSRGRAGRACRGRRSCASSRRTERRSPASTPEAVAAFADADVERAASATRASSATGPRSTAAIGNARAWLELDDPVELLWSFTGGVTIQNHWPAMAQLPAETDESRAMSKELKRRGFRFVGTDDLLRADAGDAGWSTTTSSIAFGTSECRALA